MYKILVTGTNGFVGKHLSRLLKAKGHTVIGTGLDGLADELKDIVDSYVENVDLTNKDDVKKLRISSVDAIVNLAALAQVGASFGKQEEYSRVNTLVQTNIAEEIERSNPKARLVVISTGAVYDPRQMMPLNEGSALATKTSPYALSKIAMEHAMQSFIDRGMDAVIARPFNHTGPGQLKGFLIPDLIEKISGANSTITTGNLKTRRDYTDVRDVVEAYTLLATAPTLKDKIYNVCSGTSTSGEEILKLLLGKLNKTNLTTTVDQELIRPDDPEEIYGDNSRIKNEFGWEPKITLDQTLQDMLI